MGVFKKHEDLDQGLLFPPSPRDWLPEGHLAWFLSDTVDEMDLDVFLSRYRTCGKGEQAYPPQVMLKVLLYAYSVGVRSSRQIAAKLETDVAFRVLGSGLFPDFRTINNFRDRHREDFSVVFAEVVRIAQEAGLVKLGTLAIDGSKVKANASKHQAMSYDRMKKEEKRLRQEIRKIVATAEEQDRLEDEEFGPDFRGDELPAELSRRKSRLEKIRAAKKRLEERKALEAREEDKRKAAKAAREGRSPPIERPDLRKHPKGEPRPKDQENFTDPDSRIMDAGGGNFQQSYNAQIAVDAEEQIVVATLVGQCAADAHHLIPVLEEVHKNTERKPGRVLADTGYRSEDNLRHLKERGIRGYIAVGREGKVAPKVRSDLVETRAMQKKLRTARGRATYKKRKHLVEPVFGWIKQVLGFRSFSLRGLAKVRAEWELVCAAVNLKRMGARLQWR